MENSTGFHLDQAISRWREDLQRWKSVTDDQQAELEAHLRDEIMRLQKQGLAPHEAFMVARDRLGQTSKIAVEFSKVNDLCPRPGAICKTFAFTCAAFTIFFSFLASSKLPFGGERFHGRVSIADALSSAAANGFREGLAPIFILEIVFIGVMLLGFLRFELNRRARLVWILAAIAPPLFLFLVDQWHRPIWEAGLSVFLCMFSLPTEILRIFSGKEDGEFFQDALISFYAAALWLLPWLMFGARELFYTLRNRPILRAAEAR